MANAGINVSALGLGGIDTSSLVSSLTAIQQQPYTKLAALQTQVNSAQATISSFSNTLSTLKSATDALSDGTGFTSTSAKSSDTSVVSTVSGMAAPGQWTVSVSQIAQEQRSLSNGVASSTTALGLSGNLAITLGSGASASIGVSPADTLSDIAGRIATSGLHLQASMVYDGSQYHMLLAGLDTGASSAITLDESGLPTVGTGGYTLGLNDPKNAIQPAQDAKLTVGGIPVTSATNQIRNAIPGVIIAVTQKTTVPATISIVSDSASLLKKVQDFVTAYNNAVGMGHSVAGFGTQKASNKLLQADKAVRSSLGQFGALLSRPVPGTSGAYTTVASAGIALKNDGTLALDSSKLAAAVEGDPTSVSRLFVTDIATGAQGVMGTISSTIDKLTTGPTSVFQAELDAFSSRNQQMTKQLAAMQTRNDSYQLQLEKQFADMNTALAKYKHMSQSFNNGSNSSNGAF